MRTRPTLAAVVAALVLAACGDSGATEPPESLGAELAQVHGCSSCHGTEGQGGFGPPWQGLAGSEVALEDGRTVVADEAYLRRAITDPGAERRAGYPVQMPAAQLTPAEVDALIAHIQSFR